MKKSWLALLLAFCTLLPACELFEPIESETPPTITNPSNPGETPPPSETAHSDSDDDGICDKCTQSVMVSIDFFAMNDLHGKFDDTAENEGVDELTTYLKNARAANPNTVLLSSGDMWQGSAESNLTNGEIVVDWMNEMDFSSMTMGNHEYDWGESKIESNAQFAEFPFLGINIYDKATNQRVDYCEASTTVEVGGITVGIIGSIGDVYSSIASDKSKDVTFRTGSALTSLVKAEAAKLRASGVDFIVYSTHEGLGSASEEFTADQEALSTTVDLIFEGHTHQGYAKKDSEGVYHLQNSGDGGGISHALVEINSVTGTYCVSKAEHVWASSYTGLPDDSLVDNLLAKYDSQIAKGREVLGDNSAYRNSTYLCNLVARLYYERGEQVWSERYDIVLGGAYLQTRSPYSLQAGSVTYGQLMTLFPFDNQIVLATISGSKLKNFFTRNNYYTACDIGFSESSIDDAKTYYVITDTYTAYYSYNGMTEVARLDETTFARDLLADYIRGGGLE